MRRGFQALLLVGVVGGLTPSAFGQNPYSYGPPGYGPMPVQYAPTPYGPQPMYGQPMYPPPPYQQPMMPPQPMYGQPMYPPAPYQQPMMPPYQQSMMPPPMWQAPPPRPMVYVFGPLTDPTAPPPQPAAGPKPAPPQKKPAAGQAQAPAQIAKPGDTKSASTGILPVQATVPSAAPGDAGMVRRTQLVLPEACGSYGGGTCSPDFGCGAGCSEAGCAESGIPMTRPPLPGHGHFIGDVGAYFLVPIPSSRAAFTSTNAAGASSSNDFAQSVDYGPRISLGYLFHNTWGVRVNYWYLAGNNNQSITNTDPTVTINTPLAAPFQITSPSATLQQGLGADQFTFQQHLDINVADVEVIKECQWMDTTFLVSAGGRYARISQGYSASRNNPGGANALETVAVDHENVSSNSTYDGWGPTASLEAVHALGASNFAIYGNVRGSALWGENGFNQSYQQQRESVSNTGVPTIVNTTNNSFTQSHQEVSILEAEIGLQYGCRVGRCYVFGRAGAVYQRWFDVGSPTTATGSLSFVGGTAKIGITY